MRHITADSFTLPQNTDKIKRCGQDRLIFLTGGKGAQDALVKCGGM
jgi:hypothetical protein